MTRMIREPDYPMATDLVMYITSDGWWYEHLIRYMIKNLAKKRVKGVYDPDMALKAWYHAANAAAIPYHKAFYDKSRKWHDVVSTATRWEAAKGLMEYYEDQVNEEALKYQ